MASKIKKNTHPMIKKVVEFDYADFYIKIGQAKISETYQFYKTFSNIYSCEELIWHGVIKNGAEISFCHADERLIPNVNVYNNISGPGITLSGAEACADFIFKKALVCPVDNCDLVYNFIDSSSKMFYCGEEREITLYIRVYDNNSGTNNDRWLVISAE